jgi:hypothetical protein
MQRSILIKCNLKNYIEKKFEIYRHDCSRSGVPNLLSTAYHQKSKKIFAYHQKDFQAHESWFLVTYLTFFAMLVIKNYFTINFKKIYQILAVVPGVARDF